MISLAFSQEREIDSGNHTNGFVHLWPEVANALLKHMNPFDHVFVVVVYENGFGKSKKRCELGPCHYEGLEIASGCR